MARPEPAAVGRSALALALGWLTLAALLTGPACAHVAQLSTSRLEIDGRTVRAELTVNRADLRAALGPAAEDTAAVSDYVAEKAVVLAGSARCAVEPAPPRAEGEHLVVPLTWRCPPGGAIDYRVELFRAVDPAARHIVLFPGGGQALLDAAQPTVRLGGDAPAGLGAVLLRYLLAGIEHIFIGYDHIAFLIAAVAWARRAGPVIALVSAFTVAHSVTLSLAALDILVLPSGVVEPLIAASIVYVAAENFLVRDLRRRWRITGLFGLVHGFGFAGVLREYGLPQDALAAALAAFNLGVEVGQVVIVALAVPLLLAGDRLLAGTGARARRPLLAYSLSGGILALGLYWLAERTLVG